jgi:hypothetical protein
MSLQEWLENGWLREHKTKPDDIRDLLERAKRNISESYRFAGDPDWQFNIIYAAIINLADVALMAEGFRTRSGSHHYYAIESLKITIGVDNKTLASIDLFRKKRHLATYEKSGVITMDQVEQILRITKDLQKQVRKWLEDKHPELL